MKCNELKVQKFFFVLIIILLALDIFLVFSNIKRQNRINILNEQIKYYEREQASEEYIKQGTPIKKPNTKNYKVSLIFLFPDTDCISCLEDEITNLNQFYTNFPKQVTVFYTGKDSLFLENAGMKAPYNIINNASVILPSYFKIENPLGLVVDKNKIVHRVYRSESENEDKSRKFYKRVHSLFESID